MGSIFYSKRYQSEGNRKRSKRPKTFSNEEAAKSWAEANKVKKYTLVNLRSSASSQKKIKIVVQ